MDKKTRSYAYNKKYADDYFKNKVEEIKVRVPKGKRDEYKALANSAGKSLNQFIIDKIEGRD